jgi:hypothetical protein
MPFERFSHYDIGEKIGVGGMGEVYRARERQVPSYGGFWPRWNREGSGLYYMEDQTLVEVPIETTRAVDLGSPQNVFRVSPARLQHWGWNMYGVCEDDGRFLFAQEA